MSIKWDAFVLVSVTTLVAALIVVTLFSFAVRLHSAAIDLQGSSRNWTKLAEYLCCILCAASVLYGVYLIIPYFHKG